jgi:hypothetical protein
MEFESCIKLADKALYAGKNKGKNCVVLAQNNEHNESVKFIRHEQKVSEINL